MSAITWSGLAFTGTPDAEDVLAARFKIRQENIERAAQDPPLEALPASNAAEIKASYESILLDLAGKVHSSYIAQAKQSEDRISHDDKIDILASVNRRLDNGESLADIKTDIAG